MKANPLLLTLVVAISHFGELFPQRMPEGAFEKKIVLLDFHTSLGSIRGREFASTRMPIFIGGDFGLTRDFSAGIFLGWNQRMYKDQGIPPYDINHYYYGLRLGWHFAQFLSDRTIFSFNTDKADLYAQIFAGQTTGRMAGFVSTPFSPTSTETIMGAYLGFRYFTMYRVGIMIEAGAGPLGVINLGICTRL